MKIRRIIFLIEIILNLKIARNAIFVILFSNLKANGSIILHFYNKSNEYGTNINCSKETGLPFSKLIKKKYSCFEQTECVECKEYVIKNRSEFHLNFEINDEKRKITSIFISSNVLKYNEFIYFSRILKESENINENLRLVDFSMIIGILDIIKFKKDKNLHRFIRVILLSIIYTNQINCKQDLNKTITTSSSLFKIILYEFSSIHLFVSESLFEEVSIMSIKKQITENFDENIYSDKNFITINMEYFNKITSLMRRNLKFKQDFKMIFDSIKPIRAVLNGRESYDRISNILPFSLFISCEVLCFKCFEYSKFLEELLESFIFENTKAIFFSFCNFFSFKDSLFQKFLFLERIYILNSSVTTEFSLEKPIYSNSTLEFLQNLGVNLYKEIESRKKVSKFLEIKTGKPYIIAPFDINQIIFKHRRFFTQEAFHSKKYNVLFSSYLYISESFSTFDINILNFREIIEYKIRLRNICISEFNFKSSNISKKIRGLVICDSKLTDSFLRDILLLPSLRTIRISKCKIIFQKDKEKYSKHLLINELSIIGCDFENGNGVFDFINSMPNIKMFIFNSFKNASFYIQIFKQGRIELSAVENFNFGEENVQSASYSEILSSNSISRLKLLVNSIEGSLKELFSEKRLRNLTNFTIHNFKIGLKDKKAMINCTKMKNFTIFECGLNGIFFSQLFDITKEYTFQKLYLESFTLNSRDIYFLSNLKYLRVLSFNPSLNHNLVLTQFFSVNSFKRKLTIFFTKQRFSKICFLYLKEIFNDIEI